MKTSKYSVAAFTATRAEYGLLRNSLRLLRDDPATDLQLIVGGTHLSEAHGCTMREIEEDGFAIAACVPMRVDRNDDAGLINALSDCFSGLGTAFLKLRPDILLLLGDRYELLPAASLATILGIPIAHVCGGDVTEGAIDNQIRHALTKMAHLHLAGTRDAADRIVQMGEQPASVLVCGQPGLDDFYQQAAVPRNEVAIRLQLDAEKDWALFAYHPETMARDGVDQNTVQAALDVLAEWPGLQIVLTASNADRGGDALNAMLRARAAQMPTRFSFHASLGHTLFISTMRAAHCMIGNSSAGIIEAASVPLPAINIGSRQQGRLAPPNVIAVEGDKRSIRDALAALQDGSFRDGLRGLVNPYGDGTAAPRIVSALTSFLDQPRVRKSFYEGLRSVTPDA